MDLDQIIVQRLKQEQAVNNKNREITDFCTKSCNALYDRHDVLEKDEVKCIRKKI